MLVQAFVNVKGSKKMNKMNWWQKKISKRKHYKTKAWSVFPLGIIEGIKG